MQGTYDGVAQQWHWDNLDLRAVTPVKIGKTDMTLGLSLNNAPTVQDAWNTLPAWGFPYTSSTLSPDPRDLGRYLTARWPRPRWG